MMDETIKSVLEFTRAFGLEERPRPGIPAERVSMLRVQLVGEEISELSHGYAARSIQEVADALTDIQYVIDGSYIACGLHEHKISVDNQQGNLFARPRLADENVTHLHMATFYKHLSNLSIAFHSQDVNEVGIQLHLLQLHTWKVTNDNGLWRARLPLFREVHRSNMSKLDENGQPIRNEAGRVVKSALYTPPALDKVLAAVVASYTVSQNDAA